MQAHPITSFENARVRTEDSGVDRQQQAPAAEIAFWTLLTIYLIYAVVFVVKASFVIDGTRFYSLFDDAMISMQYAKNMVMGHGLVWNPGGAAVEGFSNPLWVLWMAFWHTLPIAEAKISLCIQITGLALCLACLVLVRRIAASISGGNPWVWLPAVTLTATYLPFHFWALRGMETPLIAFLILLAVSKLCEEKGSAGWSFYLALGAGLLVRVDFVVAYGGLVLYLLSAQRLDWRKTLFRAFAVFIMVLGAATCFRYFYYGEFLPNTYYLKMWGIPWGPRVHRGALMAAAFVWNMSLIVFVLPFAYLLLRPRMKRVWLLAGLFVLHLLYSIHVGGDAWEWWGHGANRFIVVVMPLFFILTALTLTWTFDHLLELVKWNWSPGKAGLLLVALILVVVQLHGGRHGVLLQDLLHARGPHIEDDEAQVRYALKLSEITTPRASIAVAWGGAIPYFSLRPVVDVLGKNDAHIARTRPVVRSYRDIEPGHNKFDFAYSIGQLAPDVVAHSYHVEDDLYLSRDYQAFAITDGRIAGEYNPACYLRVGSPHIRWDVVHEADWLSSSRPLP